MKFRQLGYFLMLALMLLLSVSRAWAAVGGVEYNIRWSPADSRYHVYMRPTITPSPDLSMTGQVTLRVPHAIGTNTFTVTDIQAKAKSIWSLSSQVQAPTEDKTVDYLSFTYSPIDVKAMAFSAGVEQEAFSFKNTAPCMGSVALMDNATDPFNQPPANPTNSAGTNSGNQFANAGWGMTDDNDYKGNYGVTADCRLGDVTAKLTVKLLLQGAYDSASKLMRDDLRRQNLIPLAQPYNINAFGYKGQEVATPSLLTVVGNDAPVDWVLVEIRDASNPTVIKAQRAGLVQRDGDVMDASTGGTLNFPTLIPGSYYVSVRHRNHLGIMTAAPVNISSTPGLVDFTVFSTATYGTNARTPAGTAALLQAGNANMDDRLIANGASNDRNQIFGLILSALDNTLSNTNYRLHSYQVTDINMDGDTIFSGPSNDVNLLFGNILMYSGNSTSSANYIINQQLP